MIAKNTESTIAYRCPHCGSGILSLVGVFALSGDMIKLKCDCGHSSLLIQKTGTGDLRLSVPCLMCPRPHQFVISKNTFFDKTRFTLPCSMTDTDICFIGHKDEVLTALDDSEKQILSILHEAGYTDVRSLADILQMRADIAEEEDEEGEEKSALYDPNFTDNHMYDMVLFVVKELLADGKIFCRCTEHGDEGEYDVICDREDIFVMCKRCGARKAILCNGSLGTQAFLDSNSLYLEGAFADDND